MFGDISDTNYTMSGVDVMKIAIALFLDADGPVELKYISIYHLLVHLKNEEKIKPDDFDNFTYDELQFIKKSINFEENRIATKRTKTK